MFFTATYQTAATMTKQRKGTVFPERRNGKKTGRFIAQIRVQGPDGSRPVSKTGKSRQHALMLLEELNEEHRAVGAALSHCPTVSDFVADWLECYVKHANRGTTYDSYKTAYTQRIKPYFGATRLRDVTLTTIAQWVDWMKSRDQRTRSHQYAWTVLKTAFAYAVKSRLIRESVFQHAAKPKHTQVRPKTFATRDAGEILQAAASHRLYALFALAFATGLRQGELFGLHWDDIDFEHGVITISRQAVERSGRTVIGPPKSKAGERTIPIPDEVVQALHARKALAVKEGHAGNPIVFPSSRGTYMRRSNFANRHWKPLLAELGLPLKGMHAVRHTTASHLLREKVPVHVTQALMGHSSPAITLSMYAHVTEEDHTSVRAAATKLRAIS